MLCSTDVGQLRSCGKAPRLLAAIPAMKQYMNGQTPANPIVTMVTTYAASQSRDVTGEGRSVRDIRPNCEANWTHMHSDGVNRALGEGLEVHRPRSPTRRITSTARREEPPPSQCSQSEGER